MAPNERWSLDFVSDQLNDGRRFRILTVVDCTRECQALVADTSLLASVWPGTVGDDDPGKMDVLIDEFVQGVKQTSRLGLAVDELGAEALLLGYR